MENRFLVTGCSKIPSGISAADIYTVMCTSIEEDADTEKIIKADCSLVTELARDFVKRILEGEKLAEIDYNEYKFKNGYHGSAKKALITASKICCDKCFKSLRK